MRAGKSSASGVSVTEYVFFVVLFGFLSLISFPMYMIYVNGQRRSAADSEMHSTIAPALQRLFEDTGAFPPSKPGDDPDVVENHDQLGRWQGPYIRSWPAGPPGWTPPGGKGAYQYRNFYYQGYHTVVLWCYGLNRVPETDITMGQPQQGDDLVIYLLRSKQ